MFGLERACQPVASVRLAWIFCLLCAANLSFSLQAVEKEPTRCEICGDHFGGTVYSKVDQVTQEKIWFCDTCVNHVYSCFACGLPVPPTSKRFSDGRHYCDRDAREALTDPKEIQQIVLETMNTLRVAVGRHMVFPSKNVDMSVMDRVNIQAMRTMPGADYSCPNLLGLYQTTTNAAGDHQHSIQILTGLGRGETRAVIAHELTHAWIADNVADARQFGGDAEEGFCELIAYLVSQQAGDHQTMERIRANGYTRGQLDLFLTAKQRYELRTILDWVRHGEQSRIDPADIDQVRRVTVPMKSQPRLWVNYHSKPVKAANDSTSSSPAELKLKGILGTPKRRTALVSGTSFLVGKSAEVPWGSDKLEVECLEIGADFVRMRFTASGEETMLHLPDAMP